MATEFLRKLDETRVFQGPMAGYSDRAFRHMMIDFGCPVTASEMISVEGLTRNGIRTLEMLKLAENESADRVIVQLFGSNPLAFSHSTEIILKLYRPLCVDVNAGCSVRKVTKSGSGVALMSDLKKANAIIRAIRDVDQSLVVSVKFRLGTDLNSINYLDFAKCVADAGASVLTLHPRTAAQGFSGRAEHKHVAYLKRELFMCVVVASGDMFDADAPKRILEDTGCDAVMAARGLIGNPFFFRGRNRTDVDDEARISALQTHYGLLRRYEGERKASVLIRKFVKPYLSGIRRDAFAGFDHNA